MAYAAADRFQLINRRNIHASCYTRTLISEALRVGMIPIELVDDIQMQVRGVLEEHLRQLRHELAKTSRTVPTLRRIKLHLQGIPFRIGAVCFFMC